MARRNKKQKEVEYNFDLKKEKKIYDHVGCNAIDTKPSKSFCRKSSKRESHGDVLNTYLDWESYVEKKLPNERRNLINMKRFLNRKKRNAERSLDIYKTIAAPIYVAIVTIFVTIEVQDVIMNILLLMNFSILVLTMIAIVLLTICFKEASLISFYEDYMEIIQEKIDGVSSDNKET